jgi:hypothetical protein
LNLGKGLDVFFFPLREIVIHGAPRLVSMQYYTIIYSDVWKAAKDQ